MKQNKPKNQNDFLNDYILGKLKIKLNKKTGNKMPENLAQEIWSKTHNIFIKTLEYQLFNVLQNQLKNDIALKNKEYVEYCKKNPAPKKAKPIKKQNHDIPI